MKFNQTSNELRLIDDSVVVLWPWQLQVKSDRLLTYSLGEATEKENGTKAVICTLDELYR